MTDKVLFNVQTGEFLEKESPFRSISDLKDFNDNEHYEPDTSETEPGQAVNLKELYYRCERGEILPTVNAGGYAIDIDDDGNVVGDIDEAFDKEDLTQKEGFDLADVTAFEQYLKEKAELSTSSDAGASPAIAQATASAVGNSETASDVKEQ